jgi:sugar phosphate isomerase/epimerase
VVRAVFSIFPKFYQHLDVQGLAAMVREVGLDTTNLVIRDGYWVGQKTLAEDLPRFMSAMRKEGLEVRFATAGFMPQEVVDDPDLLKRLAGEGITEFRMGYFKAGKGEDVRQMFRTARRELERMALVCEAAGLRAVYQVHHGTLIPGASAAWHIVQGLSSQWIGIELDPGNQTHEGFEDWGRSARLLGEYFIAAGIKDTVITRDPDRADEPTKGWRRSWAPLDEGVVNWHEFIRACRSVDFHGTFVFMPFYDDKNPEEMTRKLKREVAYLRKVVETVAQEPA